MNPSDRDKKDLPMVRAETGADILHSSEIENIFSDPNAPQIQITNKEEPEEDKPVEMPHGSIIEEENNASDCSSSQSDHESAAGSHSSEHDQVKSDKRGWFRKLVSLRKVESDKRPDNHSDSEYEGNDEEQIEIALQFSTTLYIFIFYLQQLGLIMSRNLNTPVIWDNAFGWIRYLVLNVQFSFGLQDWEEDAAILLTLYLAPLFMYIVFTMSLRTESTDIKENYSHLLFSFIAGVIGLILITVAFFIGSDGVYLFIIGIYSFLIFVYWVVKYLVVEHLLVPTGIPRGVEPFVTRYKSVETELWILQFAWTFLFIPIVSGWARFGLFSSNIYIRGIGGGIGALVILYMLLFLTFVAYAGAYSENRFIEKFGELFVLRGFAYDEIIPKASVNALTKPFKSWSWWFQTLFLVERLFLALIDNIFLNLSNDPDGQLSDRELTSSYVSLGIIIFFAIMVFVFLPYLAGTDNLMDHVARISNTLMLILAILSTQFYSDDTWQLVIGIIMLINSLGMVLFWLYHFDPVVLFSSLLKRLKYWYAVLKWGKVHNFEQVDKILSKRKNRKVESVEWKALTIKQRHLTMCVRRSLTVNHISEIESAMLSLSTKEEFSLSRSSELERKDRKLIRRYGYQTLTDLRVVDLSGCSLDADCCRAFSTHPGVDKLQKLLSLNLSQNPKIGAEGVAALAGELQKQSSLMELCLYGCNIGNDGVKTLGNAIKYNNVLKKLVLYDNNISCSGSEVLFTSLAGNSALTSINLRKNDIIDADAIGKCLATNTVLSELVLRYNRIPPDGLRIISDALKDNNTLEMLNFQDQITVGEFFDGEYKFRPTSNKFTQNLLAHTLGYNNTVQYTGKDSFIMQARNWSFFTFEGVEWDKDSDYTIYREKTVTGWSKVAWDMAEKGLCAMLTTAIRLLTKAQREQLRAFVNSTKIMNGEAETDDSDQAPNSTPGSPTSNRVSMMELVLQNGVSHVCDAVKILHESGSDLGQKNGRGVPLMTLCHGHSDYDLRCWIKMVAKSYAGRYRVLENTLPIYKSSSCTVLQAENIYSGKKFVVKVVNNPNVLLRELKTRNELRDYKGEYTKYIVDDIWNSTWMDETWKAKEDLAIIMARGEKSLFDVLHFEKFAGCNALMIRSIAENAANCLKFVNSHGMVHGDFKPRNFICFDKKPKIWKLVDFDSCVMHNTSVGVKSSSAYCPPELANFLFGKIDFQPIASESYDVWSFGAVLYEMLTGETLFGPTEAPHDDVISSVAKLDLMNWSGFEHSPSSNETRTTNQSVNKHSLDLVLINADPDDNYKQLGFTNLDEMKQTACDLVKICLRPNPGDRPTFDEILQHTFFTAINKLHQDDAGEIVVEKSSTASPGVDSV